MDLSDWQQTTVNPLSILLDDENPRIEAVGMSQPAIRELLLEHEDVAKLAHQIVQVGGLFPHDLLIVTIVNDQLTVLEGNRRIAALQMLLDPTLIPKEYSDKVPRIDDATKGALENVAAVIAPDRRSADPLIAQIHAFSARKVWSPLAKYRYAHSRYAEKQSIEEIARDLSSDPAEVRKFIRRYNIYRTILSLDWTSDEKDALRGEDLVITPFLYPFERTGVRELIGDVFDTEGRRNPKYSVQVVNQFLKRLARDALIPQTPTGKPLLSTRGTADGRSIEDYFASTHREIIAEAERSRKATTSVKPEPKPKPSPKPKPTPKPDAFFETFSVPKTVDQKIIALASEIANIAYRKFPIAAGMLLRSLLEEVLREHLDRVGKYADYRKSLGPKGKEGLKSMILFASVKKNAVFSDTKTADQLSRFQNSAVKDDLDNVVHNRYGVMSKEGLLAIKPWVRPIIETIVRDEWA